MNIIRAAKELVRKLLSVVEAREVTELKTIDGTVTVNLDGKEYDYDYQAFVTIAIDDGQAIDAKPYGGSEVVDRSESKIEDVEIININPTNGGPEDCEQALLAAKKDATDKAFDPLL